MQYSNMHCTVILITLSFMCGISNSNASLHLENMVKELQAEVTDLQSARKLDNEAVRRLQDTVNRYVRTKDDEFLVEKELGEFSESSIDGSWRNIKPPQVDGSADTRDEEFKRLNDELKNLRMELVTAVAEDHGHGPDLKAEVKLLRQELLRLRKHVEESEAHKEEGTPMSSGRVAVRWLQRTVEDVRHEMKEMASSLNMTAALAEKERTHTSLALIRSDMEALGHRMDSVRVDREKNSALIQQMRQDVEELRLRLQESSAFQRKLMSEIDVLKEEFQEQKTFVERKSLKSGSHRFDAEEDAWLKKSDEKVHPKFRHGHWKTEVDNLREIVSDVENQQTEIFSQMQLLKKSQSVSASKLESVEKTCSMILNRSEPLELEHRVTSQRVELLEDMVNRTERQTLDIQSRVNNITSSGIQKLHGSTMQLFEALERLEGNFDKTTADIKREMSKLDYNFSEKQFDFEELRDRQVASEQFASNLRNELISLQTETRRNHLRILLVQSAALNRTLKNRQQSGIIPQGFRLSRLESKIQSLSNSVEIEKTEIDALHRKITEKVDEEELSKWEKVERKVRENVLQLREDLPKLRHEQEKIESELNKFVQLLPEDCSSNSSLEHSLDTLSGALLIRHPDHAQISAVEVFCDMETSGGHWTVIQRRSKGDQNFTQDWNHYKNGFGDVASGDFWIGNNILHHLTTAADYALRIDLWDSTGKYKYLEYSTFRVLQETDNYRLVVAGYRGNASDAMEYHNGMAFSTPDRDNDVSAATHCGRLYGSGWWYKHCQYVNINGRYNSGITWYDIDGKEWTELTKVEMKIKLRKLVYYE